MSSTLVSSIKNFDYEGYPAMELRHDVLDGLVIVDLWI